MKMNIDLRQGDCLELMQALPDNSVDAVVTDPPYGLSFMGKKWDCSVPSVEIWKESLRVLKPGGYLLAFAGTRTQHRMAVNIEDAGFEIRDIIMWVYGSGFPKSLNIGKQIDKINGIEVKSTSIPNDKNNVYGKNYGGGITDNTPSDNEYEGWGTSLKPSCEPITVARKPLSEKTVAQNVLKWGTGGINIDACRVETDETITNHSRGSESAISKGKYGDSSQQETHQTDGQANGRFPANLIHDGSPEVLELFPYTKSGAMKKAYEYTNNGFSLGKPTGATKQIHEASEGSAARFFYIPKASKSERNRGCEPVYNLFEQSEGLEDTRHADRNAEDGVGGDNPRNRTNIKKKNFHPTVKPIALMEYLIKLVSREGATVLDPFMGSGTTGIACKKLKRNFIGMEMDESYFDIATKRINYY